MILGNGRNKEEDFYGKRIFVVGGDFEKRGEWRIGWFLGCEYMNKVCCDF